MDEISLLKSKVADMEKRLRFLEDTFATIKDFNISSEAGQYIASRQHAISMSKLINSVAGDQRLDMSAQQREIERLTAEKQSADARIKAALKNVDYSVDMDDALINQFSYTRVTGGIEIQSFAGFDSVDEIAIPSTIQGKAVVSIGKQAFENVNVKRIHLPDTIQNIDEKAFSGCKQLTSINFPISIKSIGSWAFAECSSLDSIELPPKTTTIGSLCFYRSGIRQISIPGSLKKLSSSCFDTCLNLQTVMLDDGIQEIEGRAFKNTSITKIVIPATVIILGNEVFDVDVIGQRTTKRSAIHIVFLGDQTDAKKERISFLQRIFPKEAIVYCKSGSAIQKTARLQNVQVKPLSEFQNI